jgi:secreted trypsin-like serine protease
LHLNFHRREPEDLAVVVGTVVLNDGGVRHTAQLITMHPGYSPDNMFKNDIALVKVCAGILVSALLS